MQNAARWPTGFTHGETVPHPSRLVWRTAGARARGTRSDFCWTPRDVFQVCRGDARKTPSRRPQDARSSCANPSPPEMTDS